MGSRGTRHFPGHELQQRWSGAVGTLVGDPGPGVQGPGEPGHHHGLSCSRGGEVGSQATFPGTWLEAVVQIHAAALEVEMAMLLTLGSSTNALVFFTVVRESDLDRY